MTAAECCQAAAHEIRALTGFDRVVVYRFEGVDGPGEVVAEEVADGHEPWLGLWFPASDIPPQARRLYRDNWIRVIVDVDDASVGLHPRYVPIRGSRWTCRIRSCVPCPAFIWSTCGTSV